MKNLLEDMYYKNFNLQNDSKKHHRRLCELSALIERNEADLKARLNAEEQALFEKYTDCVNELHSIECCNEFLTGFRLGGRLVMEIIFGADDSELSD